MSLKEQKPEVSIDSLKQVVKRLKNQGFDKLTHFDLALGLVTIGFKQVCKQFGAKWTQQHQKQALNILSTSQYDISWYGKVTSTRFKQIIPLTLRGDLQKIKDIIRTVNRDAKCQLIGTVDNFKRTALHLAVKQNFDVLAEFFINQGFSINSRDRQLKTPLHYCRSQLVCQILLKKGANVFVKDNKLCTPAHYAAQIADSKVLQILLKKSNIANECDSYFKSPIFYAIFNTSQQQINIIRVLTQNGAKVNEKDIDGRTPLHYAAQSGKSRCIPFLLQKGASIQIRDKKNKTPLDLACNEKIKKILLAYSESKGLMSEMQQKQKRQDYLRIQNSNKHSSTSQLKESRKQNIHSDKQVNTQIYTKQLNQVSTWIRQKFFVLMKKLQQSGVKANWHIKRPYIYTGSWAEDVQSLEELYQTFLNVSGPQAAMRAFNILCPYQKPLPRVIGKSDEAFQSFFGENWFSNDPIQKVRNMHSQSKIRTELEAKAKQSQDLKTQLLGYRSQIQKLETEISQLQTQKRRYEKIQQDLRKQRTKNTQQYAQLLEVMGAKQQLQHELQNLVSGQQKTKILSDLVQNLKSKNHDLQNQIEAIKVRQAASRRKCGQVFLKSLSAASSNESSFNIQQDNLFDDDAIINLYDLLKQNPPNLQKRFIKCDKKGKGKLSVQQFTQLLQELSMLPQDVMSMHRITGFANGRKTLSMQQLKTILQNRHKNRPMWQKKLIKKIKTILMQSNFSLEKFFTLVDKDNSGQISANQLRKGLESYNIYMNHNDWCNLFNLLDSDKSGEIDINQLKSLLEQEKTGKLQNISGLDQIIDQKQDQQAQQAQQADNQQKQNEEENQQQKGEQQQQKDKQQEQEKVGEKDEQQQQNKSQKQSYQQIGKQILQQQQQFSQAYTQKDSDIEQGVQKINGIIKVQIPKMKIQFQQSQSSQVYIKFVIDDVQHIKLADLSAKLSIAVQFDMIQYKIANMDEFNMFVSVWKTRDFSEEDYFGEVKINLAKLLEQPEKWAINNKFQLQAIQFEKDIPKGVFGLQGKWTPTQE